MRIGPHLDIIWGTQRSSGVASCSRVSSSVSMVFFGSGCICLKEVMPPDLFDGEYGVALLPVQENQASSPDEGEISWFFSSCGGNLGFPLELRQGCSLNTRVFSVLSGLLPNFQRNFGILLESWQGSRAMFLETLWSSIKEVTSPFVFDVEHKIIPQAVQVNRASSCGEGDVSWFFSR